MLIVITYTYYIPYFVVISMLSNTIVINSLQQTKIIICAFLRVYTPLQDDPSHRFQLFIFPNVHLCGCEQNRARYPQPQILPPCMRGKCRLIFDWIRMAIIGIGPDISAARLTSHSRLLHVQDLRFALNITITYLYMYNHRINGDILTIFRQFSPISLIDVDKRSNRHRHTCKSTAYTPDVKPQNVSNIGRSDSLGLLSERTIKDSATIDNQVNVNGFSATNAT